MVVKLDWLNFNDECNIMDKCNMYYYTLMKRVQFYPTAIVNENDEIEKVVSLRVYDTNKTFTEHDDRFKSPKEIILEDMDDFGLDLIRIDNEAWGDDILRVLYFRKKAVAGAD